jgi:hypothetical protein
MNSLKSFIDDECEFIFVTQRINMASEFIKNQCIILGITKFKILELDAITDGQATSVYLAKSLWHPAAALLIYNIDTYVNPKVLNAKLIAKGSLGWIPCVHALGNHWSFAAVDDEGWLINIEEKKRISNNCSIGLYWFESAQDYVNAYDSFYANDLNLVNGERYIAPLYKKLIEAKKPISISILDERDVFFLGTPQELERFKIIPAPQLP